MMKKSIIALCVALATFGTNTFAAQAETGYVGVKAGWGHTEDHAGRSAAGIFVDSKDSAVGGIYAGYNFTDFFGLELGYDYLGQYKARNNGSKNKFNVHGAELAAVIGIPLSNSGDDIFFKLGALQSNVKDDVAGKTASKTSPLLGAGVRFALSDDFLLRLEYIWSHKIVNAEDFGYAPDLHALTAGLEYKFGGKAAPAPAPAPVVVAAPVTEVVTTVVQKNITLEAQALFASGKYELSQAGKDSIQKATQEILSQDLKDVNIVVEGHTDRIGSAKFNMDLSKKRARAVVEEFISQGVEPSKIRAEGYGLTKPVTGSECDGIKNKAKLNACLAPDRRVEVKFEGTQETKVTKEVTK